MGNLSSHLRKRIRNLMVSISGSVVSSIGGTSRCSLPYNYNNLPNRRRIRGNFRVNGAMSTGDSMKVSKTETFAKTGVQTLEGAGGLPLVKLISSAGSEAEVYLFGACVTSWKPFNGKDILFVRPDAVFNGQKPISGGIPHCFPQFGPGVMQQHGFARNMNWSVVDTEDIEGNPAVTLELKDNQYSRSMWDFSFHALYKVILKSKILSTTFTIRNTDKKPFSFSSALHTYFSASVSGATVKGLKHCKTLNKDPNPNNPSEGKEERDVINFPGFVDCIYINAPTEVFLDNGLGDNIRIQNKSWSDVVLWNPHLQMESCYKDFVCVENAKIGKVQLEPEQTWIAEQHISIS